tara:strand:- start:1175 stop:2299 length:1125 start_codon:yes stop_codon:yes gene_type:complete
MASYIGISPPEQSGIVNRFRYTATANQTAFTGADANGSELFYNSANPVLVFLNGVQLIEGVDFTKTNNTTLTLASGATVSDDVEILSFGSFNLNNASNLKSQLLLGTAADLNVGTSANNIPQLDGNAKVLNSVLNLGTSANNILQLDGNAKIPAVDGSLITNLNIVYPAVTGCSPATIEPATATQVTITGTGFTNTPLVQAINSTGGITNASAVSFTSATQIVATFTLAQHASAYYIRVENPNGLGVRSGAILTSSAAPSWTTAAGSLGSFAAGSTASGLSVVATGDSNVTITEVTSTLTLTGNSDTPASTMNMTLSGSAGTTATYNITGTFPSPTSETVYQFDLRATDQESQIANRTFSITITTSITNSGGFN